MSNAKVISSLRNCIRKKSIKKSIDGMSIKRWRTLQKPTVDNCYRRSVTVTKVGISFRPPDFGGLIPGWTVYFLEN